MADVKISQLPFATTPLDGTEVLPIVQSATTKQVSIANVTAGRAMSASSLTLTTPLAVTSGGTGISTAVQGSLLSATSADTFAATRTPTLGLAGTAAGTLGLSGSTSGVVTLATAAAAGTWTFTLPTSGGTNGYILTTNGSGVSSWTNPTALGIDLNVGTTVVSDGTSGRILYNNAGVLGEYAVTGTGTTAVLSTSPTFTTGLTTPLAIGGTTASSSLTLQSTSGVGTSDSILFKVGNNGATTAATIDTSGNLGLGVTPSGNFLIQTPSTNSSIAANLHGFKLNYCYLGSSGGDYPYFGYNMRFQQANGSYLYDVADAATAMRFGSDIRFYVAASGSAGSAISFTQAMTLDASGRLGVGTTSPVTQLHINGGDGNQIRYQGASNTYGFGVTGAGDGFIGSISNTHFVFFTNTTERMRLDNSGNIICGTAALATNATNGFLYIPTCAGTPTGTPTAYTGRAPIIYDTTNNKIYVYNGAWKATAALT